MSEKKLKVTHGPFEDEHGEYNHADTFMLIGKRKDLNTFYKEVIKVAKENTNVKLYHKGPTGDWLGAPIVRVVRKSKQNFSKGETDE